MNLKIQEGNYTRTPDNFLLIVWCATDMALLHGKPALVFDHRRNLWNRLVKWAGKNRGKETNLGKIRPFKTDDGRLGVLCFDRVHHYHSYNEDAVSSLLASVAGLCSSQSIDRVSTYVPMGMTVSKFGSLVEKAPFKESCGILVRT